MICGSGGSKSRLAKAAGAEPAGQMRDEKLHAVVARSTFRSQHVQNTPGSDHFRKLWCRKSAPVVARSTSPSQNVQNTPTSDHFWKLRGRKSARRCGAKHISKSKCTKHTRFGPLLEVVMSKKCTCCGAKHISKSKHTNIRPLLKLRCRKSARCCGAKQISKSKCTKHTMLGPLLEVEMSKKCTPLWREAHFQVKMFKAPRVRTTFEGSDVILRGRRKGFCTLPKVSKTWWFCSISKNDGRRGTFAEDLQRCISRGRQSTSGMFIRDVKRSGRWFPEPGCILEHQICRFATMTLCDRCSTSYDLASILRGRRNTLDRWRKKSQNALVPGRQLCTQLSSFEGSLAELLRFWCCQLRKLKNSRRIASFLMLSSSKVEEVSQNGFGFKLADGQIDR